MISSSKNQTIADNSLSTEDIAAEQTLRPSNLNEYVGQNPIKKNLSILLGAARHRKDQLEHVLFYGPPGLGKTTLALILAKEMGVNIKITSGPAIEKSGDLAAILTNLSEGDILFIDEIHRLNKTIEEILYPAMEDFVLDIVIGKGPGARSVRLDLPKFTLVGATTRFGMMSGPLRDRFGAAFRLDYYTAEEISQILKRSAKILGCIISHESEMEIAKRSRFTPRIANRILRRIRDFSQVKGHDTIDLSLTNEALKLLEVDEMGLDNNDLRILTALVEKFHGRAVGLSTLAAATGEEEDTISDVHEPFLIRLGFLSRTPKGRIATENAYRHLGLTPPPIPLAQKTLL